MRRGSPWPSSPSAVIAVAALLVAACSGREPSTEARKFSEQLPETVDQLERPAARRRLAPRQRGRPSGSRSGCASCPSSSPTSGSPSSPARSSAASPAWPSSPSLAIAVLIDGENLLGRFRRLLPPTAPRRRPTPSAASIYRTLGRYFGGSITVAVLMGLCVLALGLVLGDPARRRSPRCGRCSPTSSRRSAGSSAGRSSCCSRPPRASTPALIAGVGVRALHEPREPRHPAGDRRPLGRPDAADDDGRGVRRRRRSPASPARSWRPRSSARPRRSTWRRGARRKPEPEPGGGVARPARATLLHRLRRNGRGRPGTSSLHCDTRRPR